MNPKVICINLKRRTDRKKEAIEEFSRAGITGVEFYEAVDNQENGMAGLHQTMIDIFNKYRGQELLIFEDDVRFRFTWNYYSAMIDQYLPKDFFLFYLGGNATEKVHGTAYDPIRSVTGGFMCSHAILYSAYATEVLAANMEMPEVVDRTNTYDVFLSKSIQPNFKCYVAYPAIASQKYGYSDICKFDVNYDYFNKKSQQFYS